MCVTCPGSRPTNHAGPLLGVGLVWYGLRPKLVLFEDAVYVRGHVLSWVIPTQEVSVCEGGYGGLSISWGDGHLSVAPAIGEQTNLDGLPDPRRRTWKT